MNVCVRVPRLSPAEVRAAVEHAKQGAVRLRPRSVDDVLAAIDRVITRWLEPEYHLRQIAERELPATTGFSVATIRHGLPLLLHPLRAEAVRALLDSELGDCHVLDGIHGGRRARGAALITHVLSGNIPGLAAAPIVLSLAVKSAALIKSAAGDPIFPALFAASIREVDEELGQCLAVTHWRGGDRSIEDIAFAAADLVVASGSDAAIAAIAARVPGRFIGHGHKVSFAVIGKECLADGEAASQLARRLAYDVSLWDQQGCLSPQLCYVESNGAVTPEQFAGLLADGLTHYAIALPPRPLCLDEKAAVLHFRQETEWHRERTLLASPTCPDWSISVEPDAEFRPTCLSRCIRVKAVGSLTELAAALAPQRCHLEAAGVAVGAERRVALAETLAASGVHRICPIGTMQVPPLSWRQGGRPRVAEWVEWTTVEERESVRE